MRHTRYCDRLGCFFFLAVLSGLLLSVAIPQARSAEEGTFTGSWIASGQRQVLDFVPDREIYTFRLQGHVNLKNNLGKTKDFWSECTGLWDDKTGSEGRCAWRSPDGEKAFIVLRGRLMEEGIQVTAEVVGGTGSLQNVEGIFTFTWTSVFTDPNTGTLTAHTESIDGKYYIP